jgi:hypothetical protein
VSFREKHGVSLPPPLKFRSKLNFKSQQKAEVMMGCTPPVRTVTLARRSTVFSVGGVTPDSTLFVLSPDQLEQVAPLLSEVRATVEIENATANFKSKASFQTTSDGCAWEAPVELEAFANGNRTNTTTWYTNTANFKRGIRFGIIAGNSTGSAVESGRVTLTLDLLMRS